MTDTDRASELDHGGRAGRTYVRFAGMILTSMVVMYGVMYLNTYELAHVEWSETRFFMTFLMGAAMSVIMLGFMWGMHRNTRLNVGILVAAALVFTGALWLVRSQATVGDRSYMRAMIPHHSIAVLTSSRADLDDVRVRQLADRIIAAQCREIAEMHWLIEDIGDNGEVTEDAEMQGREVPEFSETC